MERFQMENIYEANGLINYKLRNADDLLKCHGIAFENVKGYEYLTEENKKIFQKFLLKFLNVLGLERRFSIKPLAINFVEDTIYDAVDPDDSNYYVTVKQIIKSIHSSGKKEIIHKYFDKEYKGLEVADISSKEYFRFEYKEGTRKEWLHVTHEGEQWY